MLQKRLRINPLDNILHNDSMEVRMNAADCLSLLKESKCSNKGNNISMINMIEENSVFFHKNTLHKFRKVISVLLVKHLSTHDL